MTQTAPLLDGDLLRTICGPRGIWARRCGAFVAKRRRDLNMDRSTLAAAAGCELQTIYRIESGELVPRDYLRAAIAYALCVEVVDLWPALTRAELLEAAA